jgi:hypothetical protein
MHGCPRSRASPATYAVLRDGDDPGRDAQRALSPSWSLATVTYTDTGMPAGTHTYRIRVRDLSWNSLLGKAASVSVGA